MTAAATMKTVASDVRPADLGDHRRAEERERTECRRAVGWVGCERPDGGDEEEDRADRDHGDERQGAADLRRDGRHERPADPGWAVGQVVSP